MMGIASPRIIVVDDKAEHGEAIVRKLWHTGHASLFVEYDHERLLNDFYGTFRGVRLVFMDLDLAGEGRIGDGSRSFADVLAVIERILYQDNGPWALVTWTGHADHAEQLWEYLQKRLPASLRPLNRQVMDKEALLGEESDPDLKRELKLILDHQDAVKCLLQWEHKLIEAGNKVIAELASVAAELDGDSSGNLGALLYELARAEAGKTIEQNKDCSRPLYRVLSELVSDRLWNHRNHMESACSSEFIKEEAGKDLTDWKRSINTMLNLEIIDNGYDNESAPGLLTSLPSAESVQVLAELDDIKDVGKFVRRHFLRFQKDVEKSEKRNISESCELLLQDVTPPCDHAQRKSIWRRFVVVCRLPLQYAHHAWSVNFKTDEIQHGRLNSEALKKSPEFIDEKGGFILLMNANLLLSLREDQVDKLGDPRYRVREAMLSDWMGWLGRHITRLGHVWLSTS